MKRLLLILPIVFFLVNCNTSNQTEKEYIKNLEEKNRLLEQQISDLKNNSKNKGSKKSKEVNNRKYFTIGSSEKEVISIMGNPTSYRTFMENKIMYFGSSLVKFENGKVIGYDNFDGNLKINLTE